MPVGEIDIATSRMCALKASAVKRALPACPQFRTRLTRYVVMQGMHVAQPGDAIACTLSNSALPDGYCLPKTA